MQKIVLSTVMSASVVFTSRKAGSFSFAGGCEKNSTTPSFKIASKCCFLVELGSIFTTHITGIAI